jgi:hypothetical protein
VTLNRAVRSTTTTSSTTTTTADYLYQCGPNHDNGEFAHWSPFQAAAASYIRARYPAPRNATGDRLVAFMAGVASHYVADVSWHGLAEAPTAYGMIETIGGLDYGCVGDLGGPCSGSSGGGHDAPHSQADSGGEFAAAFSTSLGFDNPDDWYVPVDDLVGIYALANRSVSGLDIDACAVEFWAGA